MRCLRHGRLLVELIVGRRWVFHNQHAQFLRCLLAALRDLVARESLESSAHVPTSRLARSCLRLPHLRRLSGRDSWPRPISSFKVLANLRNFGRHLDLVSFVCVILHLSQTEQQDLWSRP